MVQPTGERIGNRPNPPHLHRASSYTMSHVFSASETRVTVPVNHLLARYSSKLWSVDARYRALTRAPTLGSQLAIVFACLRSRVSGRCDIDWGDRGTALLALGIPTGKIRRGPKGRPPPPYPLGQAKGAAMLLVSRSQGASRSVPRRSHISTKPREQQSERASSHLWLTSALITKGIATPLVDL